MKQLLTILFLLIGINVYSQKWIYTDVEVFTKTEIFTDTVSVEFFTENDIEFISVDFSRLDYHRIFIALNEPTLRLQCGPEVFSMSDKGIEAFNNRWKKQMRKKYEQTQTTLNKGATIVGSKSDSSNKN